MRSGHCGTAPHHSTAARAEAEAEAAQPACCGGGRAGARAFCAAGVASTAITSSRGLKSALPTKVTHCQGLALALGNSGSGAAQLWHGRQTATSANAAVCHAECDAARRRRSRWSDATQPPTLTRRISRARIGRGQTATNASLFVCLPRAVFSTVRVARCLCAQRTVEAARCDVQPRPPRGGPRSLL